MFGELSEIHIKQDKKTGFCAIIGIDDLRLGAGLGGSRCIEYDSIDSAIYDLVKLATGMTKKNVLSDLPFSGAKAVLMKPKYNFDRRTYFEKYGEFINELNGKFITGCDSGVNQSDIGVVSTKTNYFTALCGSEEQDELAYLTALGVCRAIEAALEFKYQGKALKDLKFAVRGVGKVGYFLVQDLVEQGSNVTICDLNSKLAREISEECKVSLVSSEDIYDVSCDVFVPCGLGGTINQNTINKISASIICGAANNQLENENFAERLLNKNILYVPDFIANSGGTIFAGSTYLGVNSNIIKEKVNNHIYELTKKVLNKSRLKNISTINVANEMVLEKIKIRRKKNRST